MRRTVGAILFSTVAAMTLGAQNSSATSVTPAPRAFTRADSLRGGIGPARAWWDVTYYDLHVRVEPRDSTISGWNGITYKVLRPNQTMQIDLQPPLAIDSVVQEGRKLAYRRDGNAWFVTLASPQRAGASNTATVYYHGKPRAAQNPPWDGGFIWRTDSAGNPWVSTANQGIGASIWWPNKDHYADEPDSQLVSITVPAGMTNISNGRLRGRVRNADSTWTWNWFVNEPINNYSISVNAGTYEHFFGVYQGEAGTLSMDFWPLKIHVDTARKHWAQTASMLKCFENWFGPYPWYRDGFKLIEAPYLGMEHQSAVTYGNAFKNGYRGRDLSGTGRGENWDFIIVHESAHEWWANSITMNDAAYMWVHESFANYSENLYVECLTNDKKAGAEYVLGTRRLVNNRTPIEGVPGVDDEGNGNDMYYKGGNVLHNIRQLVNDDAKWKGVLRGLQSTFRHQTVSGPQVEAYMEKESGIPLKKVFDQFLRTTQIPELEYRLQNGKLSYRWTKVVAGFEMPVMVTAGGAATKLMPRTAWKNDGPALSSLDGFAVDANYYVTAKAVP